MIILDIEASGLHPESYPIEIAWQDTERSDNFDTLFIKPAETWTYWDDYAETKIHHISRHTIIEQGIPIEDACLRLNRSLEGKTIYSDAIEYDQRWMMKLFNVAGVVPTFNFGSILDFLPQDGELQFNQLLEEAEIKHRALDDARQISSFINKLTKS